MRVVFALAVPALAAALFAACGTDYVDDPKADAGLDGAIEASSSSGSTATAKSNAAPCAANAECTSGHCVDAVCCDSACDGICESCNLGSQAGHCTAVPDGQNPDQECAAQPADALTPDADAGSAPDADAGDADAALPEPPPVFVYPTNIPTPAHPELCAGTCNGQRACKYAGKDVHCGDSFCGDAVEEGREVCDGKGNCSVEVAACVAYACTEGSPGCKTTCTSPTDCLETHYCDGASGTCKPRAANGVSCANDTTCVSGNCITGVCCNTPCEAAAGGSCTTAGHAGECTCAACPGGTCQLFYQDLDGDGYGDANATVGNSTAKFGCAGTPPPGFVADHTDCFDAAGPLQSTAALVHPGQVGWFTSGYTPPGAPTPSFDYDCDGKREAQLDENGKCTACQSGIIFHASAPIPPGCLNYSAATCTTVNQKGYHSCSCLVNTPFFLGTVTCGMSSTAYTCGICAAASGEPPLVTAGSTPQGCH